MEENTICVSVSMRFASVPFKTVEKQGNTIPHHPPNI